MLDCGRTQNRDTPLPKSSRGNTPAMTIAAKAFMGMALKTGVRHSRVMPTRAAVTSPAKPDLAPVYLATADLAKEPVVG